MRQVSVRLTSEVVERLDDAARERGATRSDLVQSWCLEAVGFPGGVFPRVRVDQVMVQKVRKSGHELNMILAQIHAGEPGYQSPLISALDMVISDLESLPRIEAITAYSRKRDSGVLTARISVAVSPAVVELFDAAASVAGFDRSGWVRDCVLHGVGLDRYRVPDDSVQELTEVVRRQVSLFVQSEMVGGVQAQSLAQRGLELTEMIA